MAINSVQHWYSGPDLDFRMLGGTARRGVKGAPRLLVGPGQSPGRGSGGEAPDGKRFSVF